MQITQLGHDERLLDQTPWVGRLEIAAPNGLDGFSYDFFMGIRKVSDQLNIDELEIPPINGLAQVFNPDYVNVGNRQHPPAIIAFRVIEDVKLPRMKSPNACLVCQTTQGSIDQLLPLVNKGSGQRQLAIFVPASSADERNFEATFVDRQECNIHGNTGARVLMQVADSHGTTLEQSYAKSIARQSSLAAQQQKFIKHARQPCCDRAGTALPQRGAYQAR